MVGSLPCRRSKNATHQLGMQYGVGNQIVDLTFGGQMSQPKPWTTPQLLPLSQAAGAEGGIIVNFTESQSVMTMMGGTLFGSISP